MPADRLIVSIPTLEAIAGPLIAFMVEKFCICLN